MRYAIAKALIEIARAVSPEAWADDVNAQASKASATAMMAALDRMDVGHCQVCPQTRGLWFFAGRAYCNRHQPAAALDACLAK